MNKELATLHECVKIYEQIIRQEREIHGVVNPTFYFVKNQIQQKIELFSQL